jgi:hypothetical protein
MQIEKIPFDKIFKVKMISTTNSNFTYKIGQEGLGQFSDTMFVLNDGFQTSFVTEITQEEDILTIKTRNSAYVFEVLDGTIIPYWKLDNETKENYENYIKGF